ncbi:hypothetical protein M0802_002996 [Mischocyttarus mexicanus]|nr:hypothetical protein M0802_002996 [Mischocyttarus mexicanus]
MRTLPLEISDCSNGGSWDEKKKVKEVVVVVVVVGLNGNAFDIRCEYGSMSIDDLVEIVRRDCIRGSVRDSNYVYTF